MTTPPDVFLSYNREDQAAARRFADAFQREGFNVWWDATLRSGEAYDEVTESALRTAKAVVVLWSKKSVVSRWVRAEATLADRNKTLVPAMIEPCDRPIMFELTQTADLSHWQGDANDPAWRAYVADVRRFTERASPASSTAQAPGPPLAHPSPATASPTPAPVASERGGEPNLVVLPIANRSGLPEDEVFAADLTSELIGELSQHGWAKVITPVVTAAQLGATVDLRALARELDARYALQAHIRRIGSNVRLTVELLEAGAGRIIWTQKYDRPLEDLAALGESLAIEVASHVGEQLISRLEFERAASKTGGWTAWERTLRAMASTAHLNSQSMRGACEEAREALAIAPDYALAHAMLAFVLGYSLYLFGAEPALEEVRLHIRRAVDLDSNDPRVMRLASMASSCIGDTQTGLRFAKRAIELAPHVGHAYYCLALAHLRPGQDAELIAALDTLQKFTPQVFYLYVSQHMRAIAHFSQGQLAAARDALDRSLELNPNFVHAQKWKAIVSALLGQHDEARRAVLDMRATEPSLTLENHASQIMRTFADPTRAAEAVATLRKVWADTESAA
ncbi:MAG: TIR domain-containing protein [Steroidobacteraceae bacterium]